MGDAAVAQEMEQPGRNGMVAGLNPAGGSEEGRAQGHARTTVVLRLVGVATLVGHRVQEGDATLHSCVGGYGPVATTASEAADLLLCNRPVRIPAHWEQTVRRVIAMRALRGRGPEEAKRQWSGRELLENE